jgi:hypothetical protein
MTVKNLRSLHNCSNTSFIPHKNFAITSFTQSLINFTYADTAWHPELHPHG